MPHPDMRKIVPAFFLLCGIAAASPCGFAAASPYGICAHLIRHDHGFRDEESAWIAAAGAGSVRFAITWTRLQKTPDAPFDFAEADATVADAEAHGLVVLPILYGAPKWAWPTYEHLEEFGHYVETVVSHYAGRFPAVEIWNEENITSFWKEEPCASNYVAVLRCAYEAAKRARPEVEVYMGGTAGVPLGYIEEIYKSGGGAFFDAMNVHPYSHPYEPEGDLEKKLEDLRALMAKYGDGDKPVVITEHGWPTHDASVKGANILLAGLAAARPEQKSWRAVYAATKAGPDGGPPRDIAEAIEESLPPGSSCEACFGARLRERLAAGDVDVVIYPFDSSFPEDTFDDVVAFVKRGGVIADTGGAPLWWRCRETAPGVFERVAQDNGADPLREKLRIDVDAWWLNPALPQEARAFPTAAAKAAGYKGDPAGERVSRFQTPRLLAPGDEFIPLLTVPLAAESAEHGDTRTPAAAPVLPQGRAQSAALADSAVAASVVRFGSDFTGAVVLSGDRTRGVSATNDEANQARYLARGMAIAFAEGVERYFWYEFRGLEEEPGYSEHHFGMAHSNFTPKPAFGAYRNFTLARPAGSVQAPGPWRDGRGFYFPQWTRPDGTPAGIVWKTGETEKRELRFAGARDDEGVVATSRDDGGVVATSRDDGGVVATSPGGGKRGGGLQSAVKESGASAVSDLPHVVFRDHTGRLLAPARVADRVYSVPVGENPVYFEGGALLP